MDAQIHNQQTCKGGINAVNDAMYALNGKWRIQIIVSLTDGPKHFKEIERSIDGITPKVLSKELRELALNEFIERKVYDGFPAEIIYELTPHSDSMKEIIESLMDWGKEHKAYVLKKSKTASAQRKVQL